MVFVVIFIYIILVTLYIINHNNKVIRNIQRKNGIIHNGIKVVGHAKRRASSIYVYYNDPTTKKEVGYLANIFLPKSQKGVIYTCDVYILNNECYATNFR